LRRPPFLGGTFAPFSRASDKPIAIACFRLFTFPPRPPFPLRNVPLFLRRIALSTRLLAALPYFRPLDFREDRFLVGMIHSAAQVNNDCRSYHHRPILAVHS
jgi:hypothetical protein